MRELLQLEALPPRIMPAIYHVGPAQAYQDLYIVPWDQLAPGDRVQIDWQATPYHDTINVGMVGTAAQHITIEGIPGPSGDLPAIDGTNANQNAQQTYFGWSGIFVVAQWTGGPHAAFIDIRGLELSGATRENGFAPGAAGVSMYQCDHVSITGCYIHDNENGIFAKSDDSYGNVSDVYVAWNYVAANGRPDSDRFHNTYVEADGITYEFNYFLDVQGGSNVSDRSAGLIFRYNVVRDGAIVIGISEPEDAPSLVYSPLFGNDYIYGNVITNTAWAGAVNIIEFGGINGDLSLYQKNLFFYDNTVVNRNDRDLGGRWQTTVFKIDSNDQQVYVANNIFFNTTQDGNEPGDFNLAGHSGTFYLGVNWINVAYSPWNDGYQGNNPHEGVMYGAENLILGDDPGFVDQVNDNFNLASGSPCAGSSGQLADDLPVPQWILDSVTGSWLPRDSLSDLGACA
jgi:hypothetical protein